MSPAFTLTLPQAAEMSSMASSRRMDIQGLRALAVMLVVIFHAGLPLPGGFVGVDVFFVISGFVITGMLARELENGNRLDLQTFYLRRIRRLLPALATTSIAVAAVAILANPIGTQITTAYTGMATSLFVANGYLYRSAPGYFSPGAEFNPMLHTWSLSVEEQFYFLFPLTLLLAWRIWGNSARPELRRQTVVALIIAVLCLSFWISCTMSYGLQLVPGISAPAQFAFYSSPTRAWEFAAGALLAFGSGWFGRLPASAGLAAGAAGLALLVWSAVGIDGSMRFPGWVACVPVGGTMLMIIGGSTGRNWIAQLFSTRLAVWIGDRSYGWYLWHWPFVVFARALLPESASALVVASALSLLPAWASYRFIETPLRSAMQPSRRSTLTLAAACMFVPILAFAGLAGTNRAIMASSGAVQIEAALQLHSDEVRHCEGSKPLRSGQQENCTWRVPAARGKVLLLGDSNAGQFTEPVVQAANAAGYDVTVATLAACPFVDLQIYGNGIANEPCQTFVAQALAEIDRQRPSLIILAAATDGYIEEPSTSLRADPQSALVSTPSDKAGLWSAGLSSVLQRLNRAAPVLLVHPVPRFRTWTLASCAAGKVLFAPLSCGESTTRSAVDAWRQRALEAEAAAIAANPGTAALDLADALCTSSSCSVTRDGIWMFRDGAHLSVPGALSLSGQFQAAIENLARPVPRP